MPASAEPESETTLSGRVVLGRYRVVRPLARGGMGVVYLGRVEGSAGFAKPVVIKTSLNDASSLGEGEQLFAREARIVSHLQHPGIVAVIDFGRVERAHVMVLEYVHGYTLGQWFRYVTEVRGGLPLQHAVHVMLGVLDALDFAHRLTRPDGAPFGIVHRDISPGNVLIDLQGRVKLADFGIARTADDEFKTQEGVFRGTLPFSAPELLRGEPFDGRGDEYACAVLLYQILTGVHPFRGSETANTITRILTHTPDAVSSLRPDVSAELDAAIMKAMAKEPAERFASVGEFAEAIRHCCTWPERDAAQEFATQIEEDFLGDMPAVLGIEPLGLRDASWRDAQETPDGGRVALSSSPPEMRSVITKRERVRRSEPQTMKAPIVPATAPSRTPRSSWVLVAVAVLAAAAAVAALLIVLLRPADQGHRMLVVEKQLEADGVAATESASPAGAAPSAPALGVEAHSTAAPATSSPSARVPGAKPDASRGAPLARAFQRREAAIQRCFQQSPDSLEGSPRLSVKFNVGRDGHVTSAFLEPASASGTPLGSCILGIASATDFGPQPEPVSFSIPIAARVVRH